MAIEIYQIIGIIFCLFMMYLTYLYYKRKNYSAVSLVVWVLVWFAAVLLLAFPHTLDSLTSKLQFGRIFDLYLAIAVMFFALVTFFNHVRVSKYERKVEELVRQSAIRDTKPSTKKR